MRPMNDCTTESSRLDRVLAAMWYQCSPDESDVCCSEKKAEFANRVCQQNRRCAFYEARFATYRHIETTLQ